MPADAVWERSLDRIRDQFGGIASATETLRVLEEELRSRLAEAPSRGLDLVRHTGGRLARIYRFARLIVSVDVLRPVGWSELAQTAGYFDWAQ